MLIIGRADAVPSDLEVGYTLLMKMFGKEGSKNFTHHSKQILDSNYHLAMPLVLQKSQQLIEKFNQGLKELKLSGRYDEIVLEYLNSDFYKKNIPQSHRPNTKY